ncbi:MAG TPA: HAD family hydrolase, partial [Candidatus Poseidoniales archaeon]|nr:HAD family hydrolase [Candidatus Poseidoniales archaeon]
MDKSLDGIRVVFLDLDGTIYLGDNLIDGSLEFLNRCEKKGIQRFFLSNNSSKSVTEYLAKLHGLGIPAEANDVLLSTHDLLSWLGNEEVTETFLVGT